MIVDLTSTHSFVLDYDKFSSHGKNNAFNLNNSTTKLNTTQEFRYQYSEEYNPGASEVSGFIFQDELYALGSVVNVSFGVAQRITGNDDPSVFDTLPNAGRIGFSRAPGAAIRDAMFAREDRLQRILCLYVAVLLLDEGTFPVITMGGPAYRPSLLRTIAPSPPNPGGLWTFNVNRIDVGKFHITEVPEATLSTTLDAISLPTGLFDKVIMATDGHFDESVGGFVAACSQDIPINVGVNNATIPIRYDAYTKNLGENRCLLKLRKTEESIALGAPFFFSNGVCLDYDANEVHFFDATARDEDDLNALSANKRIW
uniref:Peptidase A1 domain-containing protein n=2 Tax=Bursaphelenchus xylophilus TaxID=6326 RepID=A0A1I7SRH7_BURXY